MCAAGMMSASAHIPGCRQQCLRRQPTAIAVVRLFSGESNLNRASGVLVSRAKIFWSSLRTLITQYPEAAIGHTVLCRLATLNLEPSNHLHTVEKRRSAFLASFFSQEAGI